MVALHTWRSFLFLFLLSFYSFYEADGTASWGGESYASKLMLGTLVRWAYHPKKAENTEDVLNINMYRFILRSTLLMCVTC